MNESYDNINQLEFGSFCFTLASTADTSTKDHMAGGELACYSAQKSNKGENDLASNLSFAMFPMI